VIEGASPSHAYDTEISDDSSLSSEEEDDDENSNASRRGQTFRVGAGKVKLMEKGMQQYVSFVERKVERRRKEGLG
jgi:ATP-binding cassette subfamily F protein 3